jgi:hypothetical protein
VCPVFHVSRHDLNRTANARFQEPHKPVTPACEKAVPKNGLSKTSCTHRSAIRRIALLTRRFSWLIGIV